MIQLAAKILHSIPDDLHKRVKQIAKSMGMSVTAFINQKLYDAIETNRLDLIEQRLASIEEEVKELKKKK